AATAVSSMVSAALTEAGVAHRVQHAGTMFSVFFTDAPVHDYAGAKAAETFRYTAFFHEMLARGVYLPPSAFETWFVGSCHDDPAVLERVAAALPHAARAAASAKDGQ